MRGIGFWIVTVAAIVTIAATFSLGRWQLSRAAEKTAVQAAIDAQGQRGELDQSAFLSVPKIEDAMHRPVRLRGLWLGSQTVYLDNRQMHDLPGFDVLTPLALEGSDETVMVQRGWIQRNFEDRTRLQPVQTPAGLVDVVGRISPPPSRLLDFGKAAPPASATTPPATATASSIATAPANAKPPIEGSSLIRQNLNLASFRAETGLPLRTDVTVQQTGAPSEGLQRDWPAPALGVERNYGYAFQWFGLSALVAFLYVWFQIIAPWRRARRSSRG